LQTPSAKPFHLLKKVEPKLFNYFKYMFLCPLSLAKESGV
jgi:hypothetical protein